MPYPGGAAFRVWAPNARSAAVAGEFNGWQAAAMTLDDLFATLDLGSVSGFK